MSKEPFFSKIELKVSEKNDGSIVVISRMLSCEKKLFCWTLSYGSISSSLSSSTAFKSGASLASAKQLLTGSFGGHDQVAPWLRRKTDAQMRQTPFFFFQEFLKQSMEMNPFNEEKSQGPLTHFSFCT